MRESSIDTDSLTHRYSPSSIIQRFVRFNSTLLTTVQAASSAMLRDSSGAPSSLVAIFGRRLGILLVMLSFRFEQRRPIARLRSRLGCRGKHAAKRKRQRARLDIRPHVP